MEQPPSLADLKSVGGPSGSPTLFCDVIELVEIHCGGSLKPWRRSLILWLTSFGWLCTQWTAPLVRCRQRLQVRAGQALCVQLGGALGTQAEMHDKGPQVLALMAAELKLTAPALSWQTQRDEQVALACELGLLVGSLGRIAKDIARMAQAEIAELNPAGAACQVTLVAAQRVPQRLATLMAGLSQEQEHGLDHWQSGLAEWPALLLSTHAATRSMAQLMADLQVNRARMRSNLEARRASLSAKEAADWFHPTLGERATALTHQHLQTLAGTPAEAAYQGGESTLLELLDAYRGALEAEMTALDLEWKARQARIDYDLLTGSVTE